MKNLFITGVLLVAVALVFWQVKRGLSDAAMRPPSDAAVARELPGTWVMRPHFFGGILRIEAGRKRSRFQRAADLVGLYFFLFSVFPQRFRS